jgi:hypothetical protein
MAGVYTQWNGEWLAAKLGRPPSEGELYLAHFLGPAGAAKLISLAAASPQVSAADAFPSAAGANRAIFYDKQGMPRSVAQVYDLVVGRYATARAQGRKVPDLTAVAQPTPALRHGLHLPLWSRPLPMTAEAPLTASAPKDAAQDATPVFHSLFHTSNRREPIAPMVSLLWGTPALSAPARPGGAAKPSQPASLLHLFHDKG